VAIPEIKSSLSIGVEIEKGDLFADCAVNAVIKADVSEKVHLQGEVSLDNFADQCPYIRVIMLSYLIEGQLEIKGPQLIFQEFTLFGIKFLHDIEKIIRVADGDPGVPLLGLLDQQPEIIAIKYLMDLTKINRTN
jgi:hypothetical protein